MDAVTKPADVIQAPKEELDEEFRLVLLGAKSSVVTLEIPSFIIHATLPTGRKKRGSETSFMVRDDTNDSMPLRKIAWTCSLSLS